MASADYYREEARRCRKQAADAPDSAAAQRWRLIASEYEQLADSIEVSERSPVPARRMPMQQQAQQQQQKIEEDG